MKYSYIFLFTLFFVCEISYSQETSNTTFGKGMLNIVAKDSSWSVRFAPRIQFQASSQWDYDGSQFGKPQQDFVIRRARLKFDGFAYSSKLRYKLELGLSNQDIGGASPFTSNAARIILDAVIMWEFYKNFELWVGQTKLPGNRERLISSANLQFVDRSLLNSKYNIDRDIGFQLRHHFKISNTMVLRESFALSQGEGRNITTGNLGGHQYTGRIEILPFGDFLDYGDYVGGDLKREKTPKLAIATTYDLNNNAVKTRSNQGNYMVTDFGYYETDIQTIFVDAMFKYQGFSLMGEYSYRTANDPIAKNKDGSPTEDVVQEGSGLNLQGGYIFPSNWEVAARITTIQPKFSITAKEKENQHTVGISRYIVGHKLKVQSDVTYGTLASNQDFIEARIGFDLHF